MEFKQFCIEIARELNLSKFHTVYANIKNNYIFTINEIDDIINSIEKYTSLSKYYVEKAALALDADEFIYFIYFCGNFNFFNKKFESMDISFNLIDNTVPNLSKKVKITLAIIHKTLWNNIFYYINVYQINFTFPWSKYIIPAIAREKTRQISLYKNTPVPIKDSIIQHNFYNFFDKAYVKDLASSLFLLNARTGVEKIKYKFSQENNNVFINNTLNVAPMINGTACAGKTTLLTKAMLEINNKIDPNARVLKVAKLGGFEGKDKNQLLAMEYQSVAAELASVYYTSILDRCKYNNMIWRIILTLMDSSEDSVQKFVDILEHFSSLMINLMSKQPIIIFLDSNVLANRKCMSTRNEGGDSYRCFLQNYAPAQNMVYGVLAALCKWPVIDRVDLTHKAKKIENEFINLVVNKIKKNISILGPNHNVSPTNHKIVIYESEYSDDTSFKEAQLLEILK